MQYLHGNKSSGSTITRKVRENAKSQSKLLRIYFLEEKSGITLTICIGLVIHSKGNEFPSTTKKYNCGGALKGERGKGKCTKFLNVKFFYFSHFSHSKIHSVSSLA